MENIKVFIEIGNDGSYNVYVDLENKILNYGIFGEGATAKEAISDFKSAYNTMKEFHEAKGIYFVEAKFEFCYDIASFLCYYSDKLSLAGLEKITGINQRQLSHYVNGVNRPSKRTITKINDSIHNFAKELQQIHLL